MIFQSMFLRMKKRFHRSLKKIILFAVYAAVDKLKSEGEEDHKPEVAIRIHYLAKEGIKISILHNGKEFTGTELDNINAYAVMGYVS